MKSSDLPNNITNEQYTRIIELLPLAHWRCSGNVVWSQWMSVKITNNSGKYYLSVCDEKDIKLFNTFGACVDYLIKKQRVIQGKLNV